MESIIAQIEHKFKLGALRVFVNQEFWFILFILLFILSFFLGRLTKFMESRPVFRFESKEAEEKNYELQRHQLFGLQNSKISTSTIVASKTGKKYYFVWCKGATNIKDSKKIYFDSEVLAQKAGYTLANNCK